MKEKIKNFIKNEKKLFLIVVLGVAGVLMIALSEVLPNKNQEKVKEEATTFSYANYEKETEQRLSDIISEIDGAGRVKVMLTLKSSEKYEFAKNSQTDEKSSEENSQKNKNDEYVILNGTNGDECVTIKSEYPSVQGVVVVCDGGDSQVVKSNITQAVSSAVGISTNNITVLKMKLSEE